MRLNEVNSAQSFKGLNFYNVSAHDGKNYIKKNFSKLKELGKKYDIRFTSCYANLPNFSAIDIDVRPLKKGMSFFKSLFRPTGRSTFYSGEIRDDVIVQKDNFMELVDEAIADLARKTANK